MSSVQITDEWERTLPTVYDVSGKERDTVVIYGWLLDGKLDVEKLQASWRKLNHKWPVLSARLRAADKVTGKNQRAVHWEYRIPPRKLIDQVLDSDMSPSRPEAIRSFVIDSVAGKVEDHYEFVRGSDLPTNRPTATNGTPLTNIKPNSRSKEVLMWASNAPRTHAHLFKEDRALTTVKVTTFDNATAIGFSLAHVLFDGPGALEPVRAFAKIVNGQEDEVEPLPRFGHDFFSTLAPGGEEAEKAAKERESAGKKGGPEAPFGWHAFSTLDLVRFGVRFAWDLIVTRPESMMEGREIFFPRDFVAKLKAEAQSEVSKLCAADDAASGKQTWISTSDVIHAYTLRLIAHSDARGPQDPTPATFAFPVNMRYISPPTGCEPLPEGYTPNGAYLIVTPEEPIGKLAYKYTLAEIALKLRKASKEQSTPDHLRNSLIWRLAKAAEGRLLTFFRPQARWYVGTNWRRMAMYDVSFAGARPPAAAAAPPSSDQAQFGKTLKVYANVVMDVPLRNSFNQMADDPTGGVWVGIALAKWQWDKLDLEYRPHARSNQ